MASAFDEERKKLGLTPSGSTLNNKTGGSSIFDSDRMDMGLIPDTRPKPKTPEPNKGKSVTELKKSLPPQLTAANPIAASSLMKAVNGDLAAKENYEKETGVKFKPVTKPKSEYQKAQDEIEKLPAGVKQFASVMNTITRGNPVGNFLSQATNIPGVSAPVDSTGNSTADAVGGWIGKNVAPMLVPSGAPIGNGTLAAPYKAVDELLATGKGQKAVGALAKAVPLVKPKTAQGIAKGAITEGIAGAIQAPAQTLVNDGDASARDLLMNAALGAGAGFGLGAIGGGVGAALKGVGDNRAVAKALNDAIDKADLSAPVPKKTGVMDPQVSNVERPQIKKPNLNRAIPEPNPIVEPGSVTDPFEFKTEDIPGFLTKRGGSPEQIKEVPAVRERTPSPTERGFAETLKASDKTPDEFVNRLNSEYTPITNAETVKTANSRINKDIEESTSYVLNDSKFDADKSVAAQRLIDHYNQQGNYEMAVTIADKVATEATKAGQFIQSLSIYNRLTPEGVLIRAKQIANKANEALPVGKKGVEVTPDMAAELTELAGVTQKMTGVKELSNDVISFLERAKAGEKLTKAETDALKRFVNESKQFVKETTKKATPKAPNMPKEMNDKRVRDNVLSFLDTQEQAARERIKARGNRLSSTPLDVYADYAIIGAAKLGKGIVKFADWSEAMVKDLGEDIRPYLGQLYDRAQEALNISSKKIKTETISRAERITERFIKNTNIDPVQAESLMGLAQKVSALSGEAKRIASQDLQAILQSLDKPKLLQKVSTAQTIAQLLNPKTHVRNVLGNELFYRAERLNKYIATPIDIARSKITGGERTVTFRTHNQGEFWKNWLEGAKAGWRGVNIHGLETQFDLRGSSFRSKYNPMTYFEKSLGAALRSFDNAAYMRAYNKTMGEMATLHAINTGQKVTKEFVQDFALKADENLMELANQYGKYVTFQDDNVISKGMSAFKRGLNINKAWGLGDIILKYPKTPGAILMRALEYSPAGLIRSAMILAKGVRAGEVNNREIAESVSRAIMGTLGFSGMGYVLLDKGIITADASRDKDIRTLQQAAGQGAYQINISALKRFVESGFDPRMVKLKEGDTLYTYDWMQPLSIALAMGATVKKDELDKASKGKTAGNLGMSIFDGMMSGMDSLSDQSMLKGLTQAFSTNQGQTITDKIQYILTDVPSSFVPSLLNQIKQLNDNAKRETYAQGNVEKAQNKAIAKIPGLSEKLPKQYDSLGNEKKTYQKNSVFNVMMNPGFQSKYTLSPDAKMIVDLIAETGDESLAPRVPSKNVQGNKLTGEQFSRLSQLQGEETAKRLRKIDPNKKTSTKAKKVEKVLTKSGETARKQLMKEFNLQKIK